jgi:ABC-type polysaccharide/polyol phosphate export permease
MRIYREGRYVMPWDEVLQYRSLIKNLVVRDLRLKYRGSVLGFVWSLLNPLLMLGIYTLAFRYILRINIENYVYFLLLGLLTWNFFAGAVHASTGAIIGNANLIKKVNFPRETLPIATVLFGLAQLLLAMLVFLPTFALVSAVPIRWTAVLFVPLVVLHVLFTLGLALMLSALTTSFRDIAHFTEVALPLLFWVTPIIYSAEMAPPALQAFFKASPLAGFAVGYRDVLLLGRVPDLFTAANVVAWTIGVLLLGHAVFRWYNPTLAEEI